MTTFPVIPLEGGMTIPKCAVCETQSWATVEMRIVVVPVWSLDPEDFGETFVRVGLCVECLARMTRGDDLTARVLDVEYVPKSGYTAVAGMGLS